MKNTERKNYTAPAVTALGSLAKITQNQDADNKDLDIPDTNNTAIPNAS